jgi:hypothetical protein
MKIDEETGEEIEDPDDQDEPEEEEEVQPGEEKKEKDYSNYITDKTIVPSCFIRLDGEDAALK